MSVIARANPVNLGICHFPLFIMFIDVVGVYFSDKAINLILQNALLLLLLDERSLH